MKKLLPLLLLVAVLTGCASHTKLGYFTDLTAAESQIQLRQHDIKIAPYDELIINVSSEIPEATAMYNLPFNVPGSSTDKTINSTTSEKQTYRVDKQGDIIFPLLGRIHVGGMTTDELAQYLVARISETVENPYVRVELINFHVKVMGEVGKPGSYRFDTERVTILDALAEAGDMTVFGKRDNVMLWREENGVATAHRINLNDS